jgi:hypothetical protein
VRETVATGIAQAGGVLIDFEVVDVAGCKLMRTVAKVRGSGRAMVYLGAIQLHFAPCWWLIQLEARETGTTGMREAMVLTIQRERGEDDAWQFQDLGPVDEIPQPTGPPIKLPSDDPEWDDLIPGHPLSAMRAAQAQLLASAVISERARALPPFLGAT